jgi:hypothetical protein
MAAPSCTACGMPDIRFSIVVRADYHASITLEKTAVVLLTGSLMFSRTSRS